MIRKVLAESKAPLMLLLSNVEYLLRGFLMDTNAIIDYKEWKPDLRNSRPEAKDPDPATIRITHAGYQSTVSLPHR